MGLARVQELHAGLEGAAGTYDRLDRAHRLGREAAASPSRPDAEALRGPASLGLVDEFSQPTLEVAV